MLRNYFKIAFRSLSRNRAFTTLNIAGLALGIAVCLMIFIIIQFHTSFDNFHSKKDRIYRVLTEKQKDDKSTFYLSGMPEGFPNGMKSEFKQLDQIVPVFSVWNASILIKNNGNVALKKFKEEKGVFFTEPSFFEIFDFPLLSGSYNTLKDPNNALVTKEIAEKYFGDWKTAIGKTIKLDNTDDLIISGVLASIPENTDFQLGIVAALGTGNTKRFLTSTKVNGSRGDLQCYVLAPQNTSLGNFNTLLRNYSKKVQSKDNKDSHILQALNEVHYDTKAGNFSGKTMSRQLINILWLFASFILLIACVNFINLSTAQAVNRAKEVGVRKVLGSNIWQLRSQFITETFLIAATAAIFSILVSWAGLSYINKLLDLNLTLNLFKNTSLLLFLLIVAFVVTILAGFYPSMVLSGFNPINALKSKVAGKSSQGISLRRSLVVFQFIIAQVLIVGTIVMIKQMNYFANEPIGFDKNAIVNIAIPTDSINNGKIDFLKKQLSDIKSIQNVSFSSNTPILNGNDNWTNFTFDHAIKPTDFWSLSIVADNGYVPTYKLPLIVGRNLVASDTLKEFLVNEVVLKNLGIKNPQDALDKEIKFSENQKGTIVGVLKNFHTQSFRSEIPPLIITSFKPQYNQAGIKLSTTDLRSSMQAIEKTWNQTFPEFVFEYKFLDDKIESFYKQENQLAQLFKILAFIAIFLSCLGLYGLASFMAVQRIKEVGIRKILGATASSIVYLFSKEFMVLISFAFLVASPIAWYFMNKWLQDYPYRIELNWTIFAIAGIVSIAVALLTVSFQAIKAAIANPVKSLRTE